ncbi:MAG: rhodanese-like domain-containing protein [Candidatus Coprovivens sp.]
MKKILLKDYNSNMGIFIDINYNDSKVVDNSIHIVYEDLLINHKELLDKNKKYYIYCNGGIKSKKAVNILDFYGYDVTLVYKE